MLRQKGSPLAEWYHAPVPGHYSASPLSEYVLGERGVLLLAKLSTSFILNQAQHIIHVMCGSARNPEVKLEEVWVKTSASHGNSCIPLTRTPAQSPPQH